jgi:hypothetical protein
MANIIVAVNQQSSPGFPYSSLISANYRAIMNWVIDTFALLHGWLGCSFHFSEGIAAVRLASAAFRQ